MQGQIGTTGATSHFISDYFRQVRRKAQREAQRKFSTANESMPSKPLVSLSSRNRQRNKK
jgi:hypothetical protein